jgi:hypothetical protein
MPHRSAPLRSAPNSLHSSGSPFKEWTPRSVNVMPEPASKSFTVLDTDVLDGVDGYLS